ncbi:MAG: PQQ-binding-like beta-propeller repeat protein [Phycisphaerales bacterium]|nr:PQQ-binding-like beta-propeller repeat protein [Phycisphaerales bacterium]
MRGTPGVAVLACLAGCGLPALAQQDGWPMWQRTPTRLGNTTAVGPKTPTIEWSIQFDPNDYDLEYNGSPIMDGEGRIFLCVQRGLAAIDSHARSTLWSFEIDDRGGYTPAYDSGVVVFGSPTDYIYGVDAATGLGLWSFPEPGRPNLSPVAADGVVYYITQLGDIKARRIADGQLLWAKAIPSGSIAHPALDLDGRVFSGSNTQFDTRALSTTDGSLLWSSPMERWLNGTLPVLTDDGADGRVYVADFNANLRCFNRLTGEQMWAVDLGSASTGTVCVGHDGTVYAGAFIGSTKKLFAYTPDGDLLWEYLIGIADGLKHPPIVDGDGTIYFTTFKTASTPIGRVHALKPDGSVLWIKDMPERVASSPMLAPDGTLYVNCADTYLYAIKDPCLADFNGDGSVSTLDFLAFLNAWVAQEPKADWNHDGSFDTLDFLAFLNTWAAGC